MHPAGLVARNHPMSDMPGRLAPDIPPPMTFAQRANNRNDAAAVQRVRSRLMQRVAADAARKHAAEPQGEDGAPPKAGHLL